MGLWGCTSSGENPFQAPRGLGPWLLPPPSVPATGALLFSLISSVPLVRTLMIPSTRSPKIISCLQTLDIITSTKFLLPLQGNILAAFRDRDLGVRVGAGEAQCGADHCMDG